MAAFNRQTVIALLAMEEAMLDQTDIIHNSGKWDSHFNRIRDLRELLESLSDEEQQS
jgi:hypothetical protein